MNKIIFDLDGTLWNTDESYLYAYKNLVRDYNIENPKTDEDVLKCLGMKLDDLFSTIFKGVDDITILENALRYSIEYMLMHPKTNSKKIKSLFNSISHKNEIYIISNCPRPYLDAFYAISDVKNFVTKDYTIEDGTKVDAIKKITNDYQEKALFIGDAQSDYNSILDHSMVYFCYAKYGYRVFDDYEYSIECLDDVLEIIKKVQLRERMISNKRYEVIGYKGSSLVFMYNNPYNYFGFIEANNLDNFKVCLDRLKQKTDKKVIGPINSNTWYSYRISLDNFDWKLYPDCINDESLLNLLYQEGFKLHQSYSSSESHINTKLWEKAKRAKLPKEYSVKILQGEECYSYLEDIFKLGMESFAKADYYEAIDYLEFKEIYMESIKLTNPDVILIYNKEKLVAFHFGYEDLEHRFYVTKTIGISPEERGMLLFLKITDLAYQIMVDKGYDIALHHFQNDRTKVLEKITDGYRIKRKHFGLLGYQHE